MMRENIFVLLLMMTLSSCSMKSVDNISSDDFSSERATGIYAVSPTECDLMKSRLVIQSDSPIGCDRLKKVVFHFSSFSKTSALNITDKLGQNSVDIDAILENTPPLPGTIVVFDVVADEVFSLFNTLHQFQFPLNKAIPIEYFSEEEKFIGGMNNTYSFDSRLITHGNVWSEHAYGVAIDINPLQNPYFYLDEFSKMFVLPKNAAKHYLNRGKYRPGKVTRAGMAEDVVTVFAKHGFIIWGGDWNTPIDYMHFQVGSRHFIDRLVTLPVEEAKGVFRRYVKSINQCLNEGGEVYHIDNAELLRKFCVEQITTEVEVQ